MIVLQCERVKLHARGMQAVCQLRHKPLAVIIIPEDDSPPIAAAGDVVNSIREIVSWWLCHAQRVVPAPMAGHSES